MGIVQYNRKVRKDRKDRLHAVYGISTDTNSVCSTLPQCHRDAGQAVGTSAVFA